MRFLFVLAVMCFQISVAQAQTFIDGGIVTNGPLTMVTLNGGTIMLSAQDFGTEYLKPDGGLFVYLQVSADYIFNQGELYTGDIALVDDAACISWPQGYHALCQDPHEGTLGTIKLVIPYGLDVGHNLDAGSILENGAPVCTMCPCP